MLRRVVLVRSDILEERILVTLIMGAIRPSETSVLTTATLCNISEDDSLHLCIDVLGGILKKSFSEGLLNTGS
jgi:hypothetical protein